MGLINERRPIEHEVMWIRFRVPVSHEPPHDHLQYMMILSETLFLHEEHTVLPSLSFVFGGSSIEGIQFDGVLEDVKFTSTSCLRLERH